MFAQPRDRPSKQIDLLVEKGWIDRIGGLNHAWGLALAPGIAALAENSARQGIGSSFVDDASPPSPCQGKDVAQGQVARKAKVVEVLSERPGRDLGLNA